MQPSFIACGLAQDLPGDVLSASIPSEFLPSREARYLELRVREVYRWLGEKEAALKPRPSTLNPQP